MQGVRRVHHYEGSGEGASRLSSLRRCVAIALHARVPGIEHPNSKAQRYLALALDNGQGLELAGDDELGFLEVKCGVRIEVFDAEGSSVGHSKIAGAYAVSACVAGRVGAAAPVLLIPPTVVHHVGVRTTLLSAGRMPWLRTPLLMGLIAVNIQLAVPLFFGVLSQHATLDVGVLEPHLQGRVDGHGAPVTHVFFNKG